MSQSNPTLADLLTELKAIRELLEESKPSMCPHGNVGLCMYCITPYIDQIALDVKRAVSGR